MQRWILKLRSEQGLTLVELLGIAVVLTLFTFLAVPSVMRTIDKTKVTAAVDSASKLRNALNMYKTEASERVGSYPISPAAITSESDLRNLEPAPLDDSYWHPPGSPNYLFKSYVSDGSLDISNKMENPATKFTLCLQAFDSDKTVVRVNQDGAIYRQSDVTNCDIPGADVAVAPSPDTTVTLTPISSYAPPEVPGQSQTVHFTLTHSGNVDAWVGLDIAVAGPITTCDGGGRFTVTITDDQGNTYITYYPDWQGDSIVRQVVMSAGGNRIPITHGTTRNLYLYYYFDINAGGGPPDVDPDTCQEVPDPVITFNAHAVQSDGNGAVGVGPDHW